MASFEDEEPVYSSSYVGSYQKEYDFTADDGGNPVSKEGDAKPKILLMGLRRSGKSSIHKVVFHKMSPNETLFLESTNKIQKEDVTNTSFVQFAIWDFPGQVRQVLDAACIIM